MLSLTDVVMEEEGEETHDHNNPSGCVARLIVDGGACGPDNVADEHTNTTPSEQRAPTESVHEESGSTQRVSLHSQKTSEGSYPNAAPKLKICKRLKDR
jgi:hypothetical protein